MASLVRFVRSIRPIRGPGIRLSEGPNGTVITATGGNGNGGGGAATADASCFCKTAITVGEERHAALANPFYKDGARFRWIGDGAEIDINSMYGVICLKVTTDGSTGSTADGSGEVVAYGTGVVAENEELMDAVKRDFGHCDFDALGYELHPLYYRQKITLGEGDAAQVVGRIVIDFRNAPTAQKVELI